MEQLHTQWDQVLAYDMDAFMGHTMTELTHLLDILTASHIQNWLTCLEAFYTLQYKIRNRTLSHWHSYRVNLLSHSLRHVPTLSTIGHTAWLILAYGSPEPYHSHPSSSDHYNCSLLSSPGLILPCDILHIFISHLFWPHSAMGSGSAAYDQISSWLQNT
jgi:hypothetical protein